MKRRFMGFDWKILFDLHMNYTKIPFAISSYNTLYYIDFQTFQKSKEKVCMAKYMQKTEILVFQGQSLRFC